MKYWFRLTRSKIIGKTNESYVTLADISNSSLYTEWNTIGFYGTAGNMDAYTLTDVKISSLQCLYRS